MKQTFTLVTNVQPAVSDSLLVVVGLDVVAAESPRQALAAATLLGSPHPSLLLLQPQQVIQLPRPVVMVLLLLLRGQDVAAEEVL